MERGKLLLIVILLLSFTTKGQNLTFYQVDTATYGMYLRGQWDDLIKLSKKAHRQGIDFYYLKLRTGYAYFKKRKYLKAIPQFEKAYKQNPDYEWTKQMLYYSYLYSGQDKAAMNIAMKLPYNNQIYQKLLESPLRSVDLSITRLNNFNYDQIISTKYPINEYEFYITYSQTSIDFGLYYQLSDKLFFYHDAQLLNQERLWIEKTYNSEPDIVKLDNIQIRSNGHLSYYLTNRLIVNVNYNLITGINENIGKFRRGTAIFKTLFFNYSAGLSLEKQFWLLKLKTGVDFLKLEETRNTYANATITFYPLANLDLYFANTIFLGLNNEVEKNIIIAPELGFRLGKFYFTGIYYYGTIYHLITNDGYYVYNIDEPINNLFGGSLIYTTKNNKTFFIGIYPAQYNYTINDKSGINSITEKTNINYIKGGVIWKL